MATPRRGRGQDADTALEGLVLENRADRAAHRRGAAADGNGLLGLAGLDAFEAVGDLVAEPADLRRPGRIALQELLGERAGADRKGMDLAHALGEGAEDRLRRAAADVDDRDLAVDRMAERLVAPRKASLPSSCSLRTSTGKPAASSIAAATFFRSGDSRTAAVATIRIVSAPISSASRTWVATTSQTSSILAG